MKDRVNFSVFEGTEPSIVRGRVIDVSSSIYSTSLSTLTTCAKVLAIEESPAKMYTIELPLEVCEDIKVGDSLLFHNFVKIDTENGRNVLCYGFNATVAKALPRPKNAAQLMIKSIHFQLEEVVRLHFMQNRNAGEVQYVYTYIEETDSCYVQIIFPSLLLGNVRIIYQAIIGIFKDAIPDALAEDSGKPDTFKIAFLIGKFPRKPLNEKANTMEFKACYPDVMQMSDLTKYER